MIQLKLVHKATGQLIGFVVGKTLNRELVIDCGNHIMLFSINAKTEREYEVIKVEVTK